MIGEAWRQKVGDVVVNSQGVVFRVEEAVAGHIPISELRALTGVDKGSLLRLYPAGYGLRLATEGERAAAGLPAGPERPRWVKVTASWVLSVTPRVRRVLLWDGENPVVTSGVALRTGEAWAMTLAPGDWEPAEAPQPEPLAGTDAEAGLKRRIAVLEMQADDHIAHFTRLRSELFDQRARAERAEAFKALMLSDPLQAFVELLDEHKVVDKRTPRFGKGA